MVRFRVRHRVRYRVKYKLSVNRYRRKRPKVDASIFDSALGRVAKKERKISCPLLDVFACGQVSIPRLYRLSSVLV